MNHKKGVDPDICKCGCRECAALDERVKAAGYKCHDKYHPDCCGSRVEVRGPAVMKKARMRVTVEGAPIGTAIVASPGELRFFKDGECIWKRAVSLQQAKEFYDTLKGTQS